MTYVRVINGRIEVVIDGLQKSMMIHSWAVTARRDVADVVGVVETGCEDASVVKTVAVVAVASYDFVVVDMRESKYYGVVVDRSQWFCETDSESECCVSDVKVIIQMYTEKVHCNESVTTLA